MPTHNRSRMLKRAVASVMGQDCPRWELIIVDDGSTDDTGEVAASFRDARVRYFRTPNRMVAAARNTGVEHANGDYVCFLDDDDEYLPNHLCVCEDALRTRGYPDCLLYTLPYRESGGVRTPFSDFRSTPESPILIGYNPETPNVCVRTTILRDQKFNEELTMHEDAELWGRVAKRYPVVRVDEHTTVVHYHVEPRLTASSRAKYVGLERTYRHMKATQRARVKIPPSAFREKFREIYYGLALLDLEESWARVPKHLVRLFRYDPSFAFTRQYLGVVRRLIRLALRVPNSWRRITGGVAGPDPI